MSTRQQKIADLARRAPQMVLLTLAHHIDLMWMEEAYRRTRKDGAVGVDGVTAEAYEQRLHQNLSDLLERFKSGRYRAPPVRRVHIPKDGTKNKTRPIGIPTLEDTIFPRAVLMALEPVYEQDFLDCSYGFRPGRSPHQALEALWRGLMGIGGGWVIDLDIQSFFDSMDRKHLASFLDQRVRDGVIRRAMGKWMQAGVMEEGRVTYPERGSPQGGVIKPLRERLGRRVDHRTQWVALVTTDLDLSVEQIVEYYAARWKIEAGFREIKQEIGSAHTQTRNPDAVTNHLHFCMAATTITWIYAAHLRQAPIRRYASEKTTEFAFADVRRSLARHLAKEGFGIDCQDTGKPDRNPLISTVMRLVA